ncbi:MAG: helix-turn-helix domain-containing protein [Candidatus Nealsonbacteria bacterium]|nr:helix-turn-helix domain-containing protein [Candidatus Nealsonbacteria bacterium]
MAKSKEKNIAIKLRQKGESIKEIAKKIKISKSTVSYWCRDVKLSLGQIQELHDRMISGGYKGRMIGARMQYENRLKRINEARKGGIKKIGKLSKRDLLIAAVALYWGEGGKKHRALSICNSDPKMVRFIVKMLKKVWGIKTNRFSPFIGINKIHRKRENEIKDYWSRITKIPKEQFNKTIFIKAKNKKNYSNFPVYYGTLTIRVKKASDIYYKIIGLIEGLIKGI